ncbi:hypothetical protein Droror1_Dr00014921 [Drosera rotundifolia]
MPSRNRTRAVTARAEHEDCGCQLCCVKLLVGVAIGTVIILLTLRHKPPIASIEHLTIFALNTTSLPVNNTISFDLKLSNQNNDEGVYYDALNLTFYVTPGHRPIGSSWFKNFYQGNHKHTHRKGTLEAKGVDWKAVGNRSRTIRVELTTTVRYKVVFWKSGRHRVDVGADLNVTAKGELNRRHKKGVKMSSGCFGEGYRSRVWVFVLVLVHLCWI